MTKSIAICLILSLPSLSLLAQETGGDEVKDVLYVTDQLRLSVYPQADAKSGPLQLLSSGDRLEILQISGNYALVKTPSGKQGWVKRGFLVPEPTASLLLEEERQKTEQLSEEIEKLSSSKMVIDQYEIDMDAMATSIQELQEQNEDAQDKIANMELAAQQKAEMEAAIESNSALPAKALLTTAKTYWQYLIPVVGIIILAGFIFGKFATESRIRRRFHGLKVW
jgi:SH3 domain protein